MDAYDMLVFVLVLLARRLADKNIIEITNFVSNET